MTDSISHINSYQGDAEEEQIQYFNPGVNLEDIPQLAALREGMSTISALSGLLRGSESSVLVRLLTLDIMATSPDIIYWSINDLRYHFNYLTQQALDYTLKRLREYNLIRFERMNSRYSVTSLGQKVQAMISSLLKDSSDDSIGMLTGLVCASDFTNTLDVKQLSGLLHGLNQLEQEMQDAIESGSEIKIIEARAKYEAIWRFISNGTEVITAIADKISTDRDMHRVAQQVGKAQSRLARATGWFHKAIDEISRHRLHIGHYGISTSDINKYLTHLSIDELIDLITPGKRNVCAPVFVVEDMLVDAAEAELVDKERPGKEEWVLPPPADSEQINQTEYHDTRMVKTLHEDLLAVDVSRDLKDIIPLNSFEETSFRLSLLSFVGTEENTSDRDHAMDDLYELSLLFRVEDGVDEINRCGVKAISKGVIETKGGRENAKRKG